MQRKPSNQKKIGKSNLRNSLFGLETPCPNGTVPIRRTIKSDLIQDKSLLNKDALAPTQPVASPQGLGGVNHVSFLL